MQFHRLFSIALLSALAAAQTYTSSPVVLAGAEGNSNNNFPFTFATGRYQQLHGDLRGTPRTISALALRRDGSIATSTTYVARTVDAELFIGDGNWATVSSTFATNYSNTPVQVVNRKMLNLPDVGTNVGSPAPWNVTIPFDTVYPYTGALDLIWDYTLYSSTSTNGYVIDAHSTSATVSGSNTTSGTGCIATGRTSAMTVTCSSNANVVTNQFSMTWSCSNGAISSPSAVLVGLVNPNLSVPILCANLQVDQVYFTFNATSSTTGAFSSGAQLFPYNPALVGFQTYAQGASLDAGQPATVLPVALSNGVRTTLPAVGVYPEKVARIYQSSATAVPALGLGFALVTRFTH